PMGTGAASLAMLGAMQPHEAQMVVEANRRRLDAIKEKSSLELMQYIDQARREHYVIKETIRYPEIRSLAVAVVDGYGAPVLALSSSSLAPRLLASARELLPLLQRESRYLSEQLRAVNGAA